MKLAEAIKEWKMILRVVPDPRTKVIQGTTGAGRTYLRIEAPPDVVYGKAAAPRISSKSQA